MKRALFLFLIFPVAARAQTVVTGGLTVPGLGGGGATVVSGIPPSGTVVAGNSVVMGGTIVDARSGGARIFATYPPPYTSPATTNFTSFLANVFTQASIDGVNVPITWSTIESSVCAPAGCSYLYPPTTREPLSTCASYTVDTDTCVLDEKGFYHSYDWSSYDGSCAVPGNILVWFGLCSSTSLQKTVNLYFIGMDAGATNASTPEYVTNPRYYNSFNPMVQDVMNFFNQDECALGSWTGYYPPIALNAVAGGDVTGMVPPHATWQTNDLIWVSGAGLCGTKMATAGMPVAGLQIRVSGTGFSYDAPSGCMTNTYSATVIGTPDSFAVPYEYPYMTAYRAALKALFLHFNAHYQPLGTGTRVVGPQLGYVRFGHSVGGEAYPYCPTYMYKDLAPVYQLGGQYNWECNWTGFTDMSECPMGATDPPNPGFYGGNLQWAQSQNPYMAIYAPLNEFGGTLPRANLYGMREAEQAAMYSNGSGARDGFGSQGASLADTVAGTNGCAGSISYWCTAFQTYHGTGAPLELQQGGLSDPLDSICVPPLSISTPGCGSPPIGDVGDLRIWLPLQVASHANVIELFYFDAALAFDPNYLCYDFSSPKTFIDEEPALQSLFFNLVGQGVNCPTGSGGSLGQGNCSYAAAIDAVHAWH